MAVTNEQIKAWVIANRGASDDVVKAALDDNPDITPERLQEAMAGVEDVPAQVSSLYAPAPVNQTPVQFPTSTSNNGRGDVVDTAMGLYSGANKVVDAVNFYKGLEAAQAATPAITNLVGSGVTAANANTAINAPWTVANAGRGVGANAASAAAAEATLGETLFSNLVPTNPLVYLYAMYANSKAGQAKREAERIAQGIPNETPYNMLETAEPYYDDNGDIVYPERRMAKNVSQARVSNNYDDLIVNPSMGYPTRQRSQADMQRDVDAGEHVFTNPDGTSYVMDKEGYISKYEVPPKTAAENAAAAEAAAAGGGSPAEAAAAAKAASDAAAGGGSKAASDAAAGGGSKTAAENAAAAEAAATMPTGGSTTTTTSGNPGGKGVIKDGDWTYNPDTGAWKNDKTGAVTGTLDEGGEAKEHWSNVINDWLKRFPKATPAQIEDAVATSGAPPGLVDSIIKGDGTGTTTGTGTGTLPTTPPTVPPVTSTPPPKPPGTCADPAYAAANPTICKTSPPGNCSDPTYAAANPTICKTSPPGNCSDPTYAAANPTICNKVGNCSDPTYAAANPTICNKVGNCSDPTYAAANPTICGTGKCPDGSPKDAAGNCVGKCPDGSPKDAAGNCKGDCPAGQTKDAAGNCKGTGEGKGCNDPVYFAMHLSECAPTPKKPVTPTTQTAAPEQSYQQVTTTPGDLADIKYLYDVGGESIFAPNMSDYANEDDPITYLSPYSSRNTSPYNSYASGGKVSEYDIVTEALRLLRGD